MPAQREIYRALIEAVYRKWNSEKYDDVPRLMEKYKGQEADIYDKIVRKYCSKSFQWRPLIEAMYRRFNPEKVNDLDRIMEKYLESEAALYKALCDKYIPSLAPDDVPLDLDVWAARRPEADPPRVTAKVENTGVAGAAELAEGGALTEQPEEKKSPRRAKDGEEHGKRKEKEKEKEKESKKKDKKERREQADSKKEKEKEKEKEKGKKKEKKDKKGKKEKSKEKKEKKRSEKEPTAESGSEAAGEAESAVTEESAEERPESAAEKVQDQVQDRDESAASSPGSHALRPKAAPRPGGPAHARRSPVARAEEPEMSEKEEPDQADLAAQRLEPRRKRRKKACAESSGLGPDTNQLKEGGEAAAGAEQPGPRGQPPGLPQPRANRHTKRRRREGAPTADPQAEGQLVAQAVTANQQSPVASLGTRIAENQEGSPAVPAEQCVDGEGKGKQHKKRSKKPAADVASQQNPVAAEGLPHVAHRAGVSQQAEGTRPPASQALDLGSSKMALLKAKLLQIRRAKAVDATHPPPSEGIAPAAAAGNGSSRAKDSFVFSWGTARQAQVGAPEPLRQSPFAVTVAGLPRVSPFSEPPTAASHGAAAKALTPEVGPDDTAVAPQGPDDDRPGVLLRGAREADLRAKLQKVFAKVPAIRNSQ